MELWPQPGSPKSRDYWTLITEWPSWKIKEDWKPQVSELWYYPNPYQIMKHFRSRFASIYFIWMIKLLCLILSAMILPFFIFFDCRCHWTAFHHNFYFTNSIFTETSRIMFEMESLQHCTPSLLSKTSWLYFAEQQIVNWHSLYHSWSKQMHSQQAIPML